MIGKRMIRVSWDDYYSLTHGDDKDIAEVVLNLLENIEWDMLEMAPPVGFLPKCHTWDSTNPGICLYKCEFAGMCPWAQNIRPEDDHD